MNYPLTSLSPFLDISIQINNSLTFLYKIISISVKSRFESRTQTPNPTPLPQQAFASLINLKMNELANSKHARQPSSIPRATLRPRTLAPPRSQDPPVRATCARPSHDPRRRTRGTQWFFKNHLVPERSFTECTYVCKIYKGIGLSKPSCGVAWLLRRDSVFFSVFPGVMVVRMVMIMMGSEMDSCALGKESESIN